MILSGLIFCSSIKKWRLCFSSSSANLVCPGYQWNAYKDGLSRWQRRLPTESGLERSQHVYRPTLSGSPLPTAARVAESMVLATTRYRRSTVLCTDWDTHTSSDPLLRIYIINMYIMQVIMAFFRSYFFPKGTQLNTIPVLLLTSSPCPLPYPLGHKLPLHKSR